VNTGKEKRIALFALRKGLGFKNGKSFSWVARLPKKTEGCERQLCKNIGVKTADQVATLRLNQRNLFKG